MVKLKAALTIFMQIKGREMIKLWKFFYLFLIINFIVQGNWALAKTDKNFNHYSGQIKFTELFYDFGSVTRGAIFTHQFAFKNIGNGVLRIHGVHVACGCTVANFDRSKEYQPQETGMIDIKFDTSQFQGTTTKTIIVMTNEKLSSSRTLTIKADIISEFFADPPIVDFGQVSAASALEKQAIIRPINNFPLEIFELTYDQSKLLANFQKHSDHWTIGIKLMPAKNAGFLREVIKIKNNSKTLPILEILVRADIAGNIQYRPAYLEFGAIDKQQKVLREISFSGEKNFHITSEKLELSLNGDKVSNPRQWLTIQRINSNGQKISKLAVELYNISDLSGSIHGKLLLETDDPLQKQIQVDLYAFFR